MANLPYRHDVSETARARLRELEKEIRELRTFLLVYEKLSPTESGSRPASIMEAARGITHSSKVSSKKEKNADYVAGLIRTILEKEARPIRTKEIVRKLEKLGSEFQSSNKPAYVSSILARRTDLFVRSRWGYYEIRVST